MKIPSLAIRLEEWLTPEVLPLQLALTDSEHASRIMRQSTG
jgi:hypothetical protein